MFVCFVYFCVVWFVVVDREMMIFVVGLFILFSVIGEKFDRLYFSFFIIERV